jgi:hypothetical protein
MTSELSELLAGYWRDPRTGAFCTLPWPSDPDERVALAKMSLGPELIAWAEGKRDDPGLIHPLTGDPWRFTDGQRRFLILWYALRPDGRYVYRSGVKRGAKGTGKDPFAAAWLDGELCGPTWFTGFDLRTGRPIGERHQMPLVQVMSNSEAQSKDVLRVANAMWSRDAREFYGLDCGETRTILRDGGRMEVPPSSEASAEGDPATAIALNETHHMTSESGGHKVASVAMRNVGKSPVYIQARAIQFTNAHQQGSDSEGERSFEAWQHQVSGRSTGRADILYDSIEADPSLSIYDPDQLRLAIVQAYSDADWTDLERKFDEVMDSRTSVADAIRYYLNGLATAEDAWVEPGKFDALARPDLVVGDGDQVALFLDCSKSGDATGLVGSRLSDGQVFLVDVWQPPKGRPANAPPWLVPREEVDAAVRETFDRLKVVWFGVDPSPATDDKDESLYWSNLIDGWHRDFRNKVSLWATPGARGSAVLFDMRLSQPGAVERNRAFTAMAERTAKDIDEDGTLTHDGSSALRVHVHNARRRPNQWGHSLGKINRDSRKLVDLAVCMVGARLGRKLALDSGKVRKRATTKARVMVMS